MLSALRHIPPSVCTWTSRIGFVGIVIDCGVWHPAKVTSKELARIALYLIDGLLMLLLLLFSQCPL